MSRVRQELSIVQFQVENRQASASMDALRERAKKLNEDITATNASIKALGDVAPDDAGLKAFQKTLKGLQSDLRDVTRAQNELMKGVKAADKLWKAAATGTMESLSVKEIKAGQRGIQARMQNLQPSRENARELQAMRIAIEEGEIAMRKFEADAGRLVKAIRDGGSVSSSTLSKAKTDLQGLLDVLPQGTKEWNRYNQQLTTVSEKLREMTIEQQRATGKDTLGRAFRGDFAGADAKTLEQTITKLKEYQSVIDDPRGKGARHFAAAETQIKQLQSTLDQLKGKYTSADEVIQRFNQHLGETKMEHVNTQAQTLAQTLDEKLSQATWQFDGNINDAAKAVDDYERQLREAKEELVKMEAELAALEQKHANSSWLRKRSVAYKREGRRIDDLQEQIEGRVIPAVIGGGTINTGKKAEVEYLEEWKAGAQRNLDTWKKMKAEALGLTEAVEQLNQAELQGEEKKQEARRMTREQMQQGIKVLEDEAFTIDRTTAEGKARYDQLRQTIDQMNEEIKVAANEMMSFADAQALADKAMEEQALTTKTGWAASTEELKRAEQTLAEKVAKAKRGTAEEEAAYQKLVRQLQAVRTELSAGSMSGKQMMDVLSNPKNVTSVDTLKAAIGRARQELDALGRRLDQARQSGQTDEVKKLQKVYDDLAKSVQKTDIRMKELQNSSKGTASAFDKAWSRLKTYVGLYVGAAVAMQKLTAAMGDLLTLSDKMGEVRKTTGFTADEVGRLSGNLAKLDTRTGITGLLELSAAAGQLGLKSQEDVRGFTEAANMLMVALPEMGREGATEMLKVALATGEIDKIRQQMQDGIVEGSSATAVAMTKIGSTIDQLRASSAAAAPQITDFVKRVGAVGAQSGISIDQVAALGATVDALGMRVEMSATALSRMIPAIKNNSFAIAKAIGTTQSWINEQFRVGNGMEVILRVFDHIRDANLDADNIEQMFGSSMADVMKELNQQGARAGIVFAGLSQGVEQLRANLGTAREAYEDNIAIMNEYSKMNDTTAAKWERLKNQVEEAFVGDTAQRWLGGIITGLRVLVDFLTGNLGAAFNWLSGLIQTFLVYWGTLKIGLGEGIFVKAVEGIKAMGSGLKNLIANTKMYITYSAALKKAQTEQARAAIETEMAQKGLNKAMIANVWMALAAAIIWATIKLYGWLTAVESSETALAEVNAEVSKAQERFDGYYQKLENTSKALKDAQKEHDRLSAEMDKLRKSTDGSAESTETLKKKSDELKESENALTKAQSDHRTAIAEMNNIYGKYLGFLLTEENYARMAAAAHDKVTAAIEREMLMKQRQAAIDKVNSELQEDYIDDMASFSQDLSKIGKLTGQQVSQARNALNEYLRKNFSYDAKSEEYGMSSEAMKQLEGWGISTNQGVDRLAALWFNKYLQDTFHVSERDASRITGMTVRQQNGRVGSTDTYLTGFASNLRANYLDTYFDRMRETGKVTDVFDDAVEGAQKRENAAAKELVDKLVNDANASIKKIGEKGKTQKDVDAAYGELANSILGLEQQLLSLDQQKDAEEIVRINKLIDETRTKVDAKRLTRARDKARATLFEQATWSGDTSDLGNNPTNPYGSYNRVTSPYQDWDADALVSRRKEMLERVRALANGADVQAVLSEDAKFITEATRKNIKDTKQAIEWYNTERLKIQDALHERYLTNTGDWMDPKKGGKKASKMVQDEMKYYLDELDAYYTERKAKIQEAATEEGITEAEMKNRTLANEMEWHQRRAELQKLYAKKSTEVTEEEQQAIFDILSDRTGETTGYIEKDIANTVKFIEKVGKEKGKPAMDRILGDLDLGIERDLLKQQQAVTAQMKAIRDIIEKERPYDGITSNLRENLVTMGILTADMTAERNRLMRKNADMSDFNSRQAAEEMKRTAFMLGEAENAYSTTIEEVMRHMGEQGMQAWADAIRGDTQMQQALMAQLRTAYDEIQNAIKKEASLIKKQTDIWWADIAEGQTQSRRDGFEKALSRLGLAEDQVKRANSLIGAGQASERVADKLAIKQMQVRLAMQTTYYNRMRQIGEERIAQLKAEGRLEDAEHLRRSLNLAKTEELKKLEEQRVAIANQMEESQNRLYTALREWGDLLTSSLQSVFEASHAGDAEYYNELAKLNLTGNGGPGAGTYIVIDNEGTSDATAHYEYLDEREALERQHEIERQNAQAEAWKKVMDDINMKMSETITDQLNAMLQNASLDANTDALSTNTDAISGLTGAIANLAGIINTKGMDGTNAGLPSINGDATEVPAMMEQTEESTPVSPVFLNPDDADNPFAIYEMDASAAEAAAERKVAASEKVEEALRRQFHSQEQSSTEANRKTQTSTQSMFAKMTQAANLYGIAYQAMSNDNMSATQKWEMIALQAVGNAAISGLTALMEFAKADAAAKTPGVLGKLWSQLGWAAAPVFAAFTGLLGGLMGLATSKIQKSKGTIAQVTGANNSVASGRLTTGMLTYAEGNVNEFTDPSTLREGRQYNVDAADGKTYRARYMGRNPKTHLTNGPEFHLSGERGREMIIDAGTTRQITMNEGEIWHAIQTLSGGGRISALRRRGRGVAAFADGNLSEFSDYPEYSESAAAGMSAEQAASLQASIDRQSDLLEDLRINGIKATFDVYGKGGLVDSYDSGKKTLNRYGQRY